MRTQEQLQPVLADLTVRLRSVLGDHIKQTILFGSYARNEAEDGSDIDVLVLTDLPRDVIRQYTWELGALASEFLLDHDIVVSPIIENLEYFRSLSDVVPLYRNVRNEGVVISA